MGSGSIAGRMIYNKRKTQLDKYVHTFENTHFLNHQVLFPNIFYVSQRNFYSYIFLMNLNKRIQF